MNILEYEALEKFIMESPTIKSTFGSFSKQALIDARSPDLMGYESKILNCLALAFIEGASSGLQRSIDILKKKSLI